MSIVTSARRSDALLALRAIECMQRELRDVTGIYEVELRPDRSAVVNAALAHFRDIINTPEGEEEQHEALAST